jgi:hypothetical protein
MKWELIRNLANTIDQNGGLHLVEDATKIADNYAKRYAAALPDDLPVIPKDVSEWLTWCKRSNHSLKDALDGETRVSEDVFARAWLLGVWRVEETGEIVKPEVADHE